MTSLPPLQSLKFDNTLGAMFIGVLISATLFGLTTLQTYFYYSNYTKDRAAFKWLVGALWVLDCIHTSFVSHSCYYFLVQQYGNPAALLVGEWGIIMGIVVTVSITSLVQGFFAHRVYKLTNKIWLAGIIVLLSLAHTATGIAATVRLFQIKTFSRLPEVIGVMAATLILMAVNDLFITTVLCLYLRKAQSSFTETQSAIRKLILYTIETGLLTSVFVTTDAICIMTMQHNWIFIGITTCVSKLYANSFLTILNSRKSLKITTSSSNKVSAASSKQSIGATPFRIHDFPKGDKGHELAVLSSSKKADESFAALSKPSDQSHGAYVV